jgi:hypothetical protein
MTDIGKQGIDGPAFICGVQAVYAFQGGEVGVDCIPMTPNLRNACVASSTEGLSAAINKAKHCSAQRRASS